MEWLERNRKSVIIAVVLVIAFAAGYFFYKSRNAEQGRLILYGNVDIRQISLAFNSNGRIEEMLKEEGDAVKAGDVLARLDNRPLELAIAQKKAVIAQQEAVVAKLHNGSRPEEITQAAAQVESLAAANLENAKAALSLANKGPRDEDIAAAEAQLSALKAGLENDLYNLSQATLVAPQDGVIRSRLMETGDMASAARPVYLIGLSDPKWIRAYVPESRLGELREGMEADVYVDSFPNEAIKGKVGYISDTAEFTPKSVQTEELRTSLLYEVRIFVDDEENRLRMGMPATVKF